MVGLDFGKWRILDAAPFRRDRRSAARTGSRAMAPIRLGGSPSIAFSFVFALRSSRGSEFSSAEGVGMRRAGVKVVHPRLLDDMTGIHDGDVMGEAGDDAEIVRDPDDGGAELGLQPLDELDDLRLDRHVERRRRLVGDDQFRRAGERHGDHDALAHAAGELVGIVVEARRRLGDADLMPGSRSRATARLPSAQPFVEALAPSVICPPIRHDRVE